MRTSHKLLLRFFYDKNFDFSKVLVGYIDRGTPGDISYASGDEICNLDSNYFEVISKNTTKPIPYHRLLIISYGGIIIWEREVP
ncbi:DUF504 domain-containing protein [Methanoplanus sp. FWC-SCC4]|uniref:DUF504 domain-containing protein n=1 Tax=Methanochimaera problematica TaxID=2609417 RepID=A0AA97FB69_9EURY|nr:DUF504 domain-containing protein [Methanoplanus sp. FWC-SCC4]WOF16175.1 DUF504 domain-containing protein [Methanoplanus sp. FWC-SCC4]